LWAGLSVLRDRAVGPLAKNRRFVSTASGWGNAAGKCPHNGAAGDAARHVRGRECLVTRCDERDIEGVRATVRGLERVRAWEHDTGIFVRTGERHGSGVVGIMNGIGTESRDSYAEGLVPDDERWNHDLEIISVTYEHRDAAGNGTVGRIRGRDRLVSSLHQG